MAAATDLPQVSTDGNITWYTIKNVKSEKYATYCTNSANMQLQPYYGEAGKFYFTGEKDEDGKLFTVKIHNAATQNLCNGVASWNAEGCDWYIQLQNINNPGGYAISSTNDLTNNGYSWNNHQGASVVDISGSVRKSASRSIDANSHEDPPSLPLYVAICFPAP